MNPAVRSTGCCAGRNAENDPDQPADLPGVFPCAEKGIEQLRRERFFATMRRTVSANALTIP